MLQKWYMWRVIICPYPQCQLDISRFYIILVKLGIQQTNNVKIRVTSCGSSGGGDARLAVTSQWQRPCRPSLCSWPSLTWWLGFSAGLRAVGTSHHTGGLPGRLCYAPPGEGTWQGGVLWAQTMCRLHCLTQEIHYSWCLQIDEKAMCESVSVCVCVQIFPNNFKYIYNLDIISAYWNILNDF